MKTLLSISFSTLFVLASTLSVTAHEFWIYPARFQFDPGDQIRAEFRNGEEFKGAQLGYFGRSSKKMVFASPAGITALKPRDGDRPAFKFKAGGPGLYVLAHETAPSRVTYKKWSKWQTFIKHKDLVEASSRHDERGLPRENFREAYTRHAKSLVAVGDGSGSDRNLGMQTEFVALTNPYSASYNGQMQAKLLYEGAPRARVQVEIFEQIKGQGVNIKTVYTDGAGVVSFATKPGAKYLIDAVVLREPRSNDPKIAWETLWASMTFQHR